MTEALNSGEAGAGAHAEPEWVAWPDDRLLDLRMCDLRVSIRSSKLAGRIQQLHRELAGKGLVFRPHFWLSDEWYCPDGVAGVALPFYLAHPRLERLELNQVFEVEGGEHDACMRFMRHETGHAIDNAYRLRRRRRRTEVFGPSSARYLDEYIPRPYSRSFVRYLPGWYAQSHPAEDFAETFAVWLDPESGWERRYVGWPALKKLRYVETLMQELAVQELPVLDRRRVDPIGRTTKTLRQHYAEKRERYGIGDGVAYERELRGLFSAAPEYSQNPSAAQFISAMRKQVRSRVARWTGVYAYTIDQILGEIVKRCGDLRLRLVVPEEQARLDFIIAMTVQTMKYVHSGRHRYVR